MTRRRYNMVPYVVSNVGEWSAFFDKLVELHKKTRGSAYRDTSANWGAKLVNTATTTSKNGQQFNYYDVVDRGRAPIDRGPGKYVVLAGSDGLGRIRKRVSGTIGYEITTKSLAVIIPNFNN